MKRLLSNMLLMIVLGSCVTSLQAGHIGDRKVTAVRQFTPSYVLIYVDAPINNAASCATVLDRIVLDTTGDQDFRNRQFSLVLTALTAGLKFNPNCSNECLNIWTDVFVTKCSDVYIRK